MGINLLGQAQQVHIRTQALLKADMTIASLEFSMASGAFTFLAKGENKGGFIRTLINAGGVEQSIDLPYDGPPHLAATVTDALILDPLDKGESRVFHVLDPASAGFVPTKVTCEGTGRDSARREKNKGDPVFRDLQGRPPTGVGG